MVRISQTLLPSSSQGIPQVEITNTSIDVSDSTAQSSLSSINTALSGTLAVSSSSTISGSTGNLYNNTSVSSGTDSSIVSVSSKTKNTIYVTSDMGGEVRLYVRGTSAGGFHYHSSIYPSGGMGGGGGGMGSVAYDGVLTLKDEVIDAIKLTATGSETITASVFSRA